MNFWTVQLSGTTRAFDSPQTARDYAMTQLEHDLGAIVHLTGELDVHILYTDTRIARVQPLSLSFAGNPNGHIIIIPDQEEV